MTTLDAPNNNIDPKDVSIFPTALRYGLIGGLVSIVISLLGNVLGLVDPCAGFSGTNAIFTFLGIGVYIVVGVMAIKHHRDEELGGYASFGRAFSLIFMTLLIMGALGGAFTFLYMNIIDPTMVDTVLECTAQTYEEQGLSAQQIERSMGMVKMMYQPGLQLVLNLLVGPAFSGALFGLIMAAFLKKNPPYDM